MRGRRPKSPELKLLQGSRGKKPKSNGQLKPLAEKLDPPFFIKGDSLEAWNRLEPELRRLGILTVVDRGIFAAYCRAYGLVCEAERLIQETGLFLETPSGIQRLHPIVTARNDAMRMMLRLAAELGITPSSRNRVTPVNVGGDAENPFAIISGGRKEPE